MNQRQIMQELGLGPVWQLREEWQARAEEPLAAGPAEGGSTALAEPATTGHAAAPAPLDAPADLVAAIPATVTVEPVSSPVTRHTRIAALDWNDLTHHIRECTACGLCEGRTQAVPGVGDRRARWLVVGEAPGADEDRQGEPFVGKAGQLLDNMLAALGLRRGDGVYIANVLKCRPPNNRDPQPDEVAACRPFLQRQIELIQPQLILCVGRHAANTLLATDEAVGRLRGRVHDMQGIPLVVTWHPAYLLRSPAEKARAWQDLVLARSVLADRQKGAQPER